MIQWSRNLEVACQSCDFGGNSSFISFNEVYWIPITTMMDQGLYEVVLTLDQGQVHPDSVQFYVIAPGK